jgi:hypothetical protein
VWTRRQTHFAAFFFLVRHNKRNVAKVKRRAGSFLTGSSLPLPLRYEGPRPSAHRTRHFVGGTDVLFAISSSSDLRFASNLGQRQATPPVVSGDYSQVSVLVQQGAGSNQNYLLGAMFARGVHIIEAAQ